jgi:hypothetical protein
MAETNHITKEYLHKIFEYKDGILYRIKTGKEAGHINSRGYKHAKIGNKKYQVHKLIFIMQHGYLPKEIDHIDGNKLNNSINNLREVTHNQNMHNRKINSNNTSGIKGVCFDKNTNKWRGQVAFNNKVHYVGIFEDIDDAKNAVMKFREKMHKEYANHG